MIDAALVTTALLMGAAGTPHCMAMCGASSSAALARCGKGGGWAFHCARIASYALAGAVAASSVLVLKSMGDAAPFLRPAWAMLQVAVFAWGAWMLVTGRQPAWMRAQPRVLSPQLASQGWQRIAGPVRAGVLGAAWVAWPCGLLQSALLVAALASSPLGGALAMGAFATASSAGLWATSLVWARGASWFTDGALATQGFTRLSGLLLMAASGWSLGAGLWHRVAALCGAA